MKTHITLLILLFSFFALYSQSTDPFNNVTHYGSGMTLNTLVTVQGAPASVGDIIVVVSGDEVRAKFPLVVANFPNVGSFFGVMQTIVVEQLDFYLWRIELQEVWGTEFSATSIPQGDLSPAHGINFTIRGYKISGQIRTLADDTPLSGIRIEILNDDQDYNPNYFSSLTSNVQGNYEIPFLQHGSSISFVPQHIDWLFPDQEQHFVNITNNVGNIDFYAHPVPTFTISGEIKYNELPIPGVNIADTTTNDQGFYSIQQPQNQPITLIPQKPYWSFYPSSKHIIYEEYGPQDGNFAAIPDFLCEIEVILGISDVSIEIVSEISALSGLIENISSTSYIIENILPTDTIKIIPFKQGYTFSPSERTFTNLISNETAVFTPIINTYEISGTIIDEFDSTPLSNISITSNGNVLATTNIHGQYTFFADYGTSLTFLPDNADYAFTPSSYTINNIQEEHLNRNFTARELQIYTFEFFVTSNSNPVSNVTIDISVGNSNLPSVITDEAGYNYVQIMETTELITFTPSKLGHYFDPPFEDILINDSTPALMQIYFMASVETYSLSGTITLNSVGLSGVEINVLEDDNFNTVTLSNGAYSIFDIPYGTNLTLTPFHERYIFNPEEIFISNISNNLINQNFVATIKTHPVTVKTIDYNGFALPNITITYYSDDHIGSSGETNIDGEFIFNAHHGDIYIIELSNTGQNIFLEEFKYTQAITEPETVIFETRARFEFQISFECYFEDEPLPGVKIIYEEDFELPDFVYTDDEGKAIIILLETNNNITFTPILDGFDFYPDHILLNKLDSDTQTEYVFEATIKTYQVSGIIYLEDFGILSGVSINVEGFDVQAFENNEDGSYLIEDIPHGSSITITPSRPSYGFTPEYVTIDYINQNEIVNFVAESVPIPTTIVTKDHNEMPVSGIVVNFVSNNGHNGEAVTDETGSCVLSLYYREIYDIYVRSNEEHVFEKGPRVILVEDPETHYFKSRPRERFNFVIEVMFEDSPLADVEIVVKVEDETIYTIPTNNEGIALIPEMLEMDNKVSFTPVLEGYRFEPTNYEFFCLYKGMPEYYSFEAIVQTFEIAGTVFYDEIGFPSVKINVVDFNELNIYTNDEGYYLIPDIPYGADRKIYPKFEGYRFIPPFYEITDIKWDKERNFRAELDELPITVLVLDYNNLPIPDIEITIRTLLGDMVESGLTDAEGKYVFDATYWEVYRLIISNNNSHFFDITEIVTEATTYQSLHNYTFYSRPRKEFVLSGTITYNETTRQSKRNIAFPNVQVRINEQIVFTNDLGIYTATIYEADNVTITPSYYAYNFTPQQRVINYVNQDYTGQDFTAELIQYNIQGMVVKDNQPFRGAVIQNHGETVFLTSDSGLFEFTIAYGEDLYLTLIHEDHYFTPEFIYIPAVEEEIDLLIFEAFIKQFEVSGVVLANNVPVLNARVYDTLSEKEYITSNNGFFSLIYDIHSSVNLKAQKPYFTFADSLYVEAITEDINQNIVGIQHCEDINFTIQPGEYFQPITINIISPTEGTNIYYTIDGTEPTTSSYLFTTPFILNFNEDLLITARAFRDAFVPSNIIQGFYTVTATVGKPKISHDTGTYNTVLNVTITSEDDATIHYTLDGSSPTVNSPIYTDPIFINKSTTIKAFAVLTGLIDSAEAVSVIEIVPIITFDLPSEIIMLPNNVHVMNLLDFVTNSIEGDYTYNFTYVQPLENISAVINENLLTITPDFNWIGDEYITINVSATPNFVRDATSPPSLRGAGGSSLHSPHSQLSIVNSQLSIVNSQLSILNSQLSIVNCQLSIENTSATMLIRVYPEHIPINIVEQFPETEHYQINLYTNLGLFVNLSEQQGITYEWFIDNVPQHHNYSKIEYTFNELKDYVFRVQISNYFEVVNKTWIISVVVNDVDIHDFVYKDKLIGNYPNPFNPETTISFTLSTDQHVDILLYNLRGQLINQIANQRFSRGENSIVFNADTLSSGVYLISFKTINHYEIRRITLLK